MTICWSAIRSSMSSSSSLAVISVRRSSAKRSAISSSSSLMMLSTRCSSPRIARSSRMRSVTSACSLLIASDSSAVSWARRRSRMAEAWIAERPKRSMSSARAESRSRLPRMSSMIASRLSSAMSRPSRTWARASFWAQLVLRAPDDDLALVVDVRADDLAQRQRPRDAVDERDGVDPERRLHRRVLVELVQHDLGQRVALELDDEAHAVAVRLVPQVGDVRDLLVVDEVGDLLDQRRPRRPS